MICLFIPGFLHVHQFLFASSSMYSVKMCMILIVCCNQAPLFVHFVLNLMSYVHDCTVQ